MEKFLNTSQLTELLGVRPGTKRMNKNSVPFRKKPEGWLRKARRRKRKNPREEAFISEAIKNGYGVMTEGFQNMKILWPKGQTPTLQNTEFVWLRKKLKTHAAERDPNKGFTKEAIFVSEMLKRFGLRVVRIL